MITSTDFIYNGTITPKTKKKSAPSSNKKKKNKSSDIKSQTITTQYKIINSNSKNWK